MPKLMFDEDDGSNQLLSMVNKLNLAMADVANATTVEQLQNIINNLTRIINELNTLVVALK
jgi:hypothetical protein